MDGGAPGQRAAAPPTEPQTTEDFVAKTAREASRPIQLLRLKKQWGTLGISLEEMYERVRLQDGRLSVRETVEGARFVFLMYDLPELPAHLSSAEDLPIEDLL